MVNFQKKQNELTISTTFTRVQKEAVGLLSIGTFLEYFDLMLYVHMAVLLNELFFPQIDPISMSLLMAFAFCSTFIFRPFGALLFGWIGDNIGRKSSVIITTSLMALLCITMANLPTYAQIGVSATWLVTICRVLQGMSSMGEIIGAELYLTEITKPPIQYTAVALISISCCIGSAAALGMATIITSLGLNWRIAFWMGAGIAIIGAVARTKLHETPEFTNAKLQLKAVLEEDNIYKKKLERSVLGKEKVNKKTIISLFLIQCIWPICFYIAYIYCGSILKSSFGYSAAQIIQQNFVVSLLYLVGLFLATYLNYKIYPLKILKVQLGLFFAFSLACPYLLNNAQSAVDIFIIQILIMLCRPDISSAIPIFFKYFPIFKRFTYTSFTFALVSAIMHIINSFSLVYLIEYFSHWGILIITLPLGIGFAFGLKHFIKLEKEVGNYAY